MDIRRKNKKHQQLSILLMLAIVAVAAGCLALFLRSPSSPEAAVTAQPVTDPQALDPNQVEMQDPDSFSPNQEGNSSTPSTPPPTLPLGTRRGTSFSSTTAPTNTTCRWILCYLARRCTNPG